MILYQRMFEFVWFLKTPQCNQCQYCKDFGEVRILNEVQLSRNNGWTPLAVIVWISHHAAGIFWQKLSEQIEEEKMDLVEMFNIFNCDFGFEI